MIEPEFLLELLVPSLDLPADFQTPTAFAGVAVAGEWTARSGSNHRSAISRAASVLRRKGTARRQPRCPRSSGAPPDVDPINSASSGRILPCR
jgi:hypothetical protein